MSMQFTLNIINGKFHGTQEIAEIINGQDVRNVQEYRNGVFIEGWVRVCGVGSSVYIFRAENWGGMEKAYTAAEMFAADCFFNIAMVKKSVYTEMLPNNELAVI